MRRTDSILKALDIDTDRYPVLSVVGGGGKTSLIFRMMEELTAVGKKVLITTTTHMAYEPDRPFAEDGDIIRIKQNLEEHGYTIAAALDREKCKISALPEEKLKEIKALADVILIEADGAKRCPLKVPASWEPVIWKPTDLVIAVAGMDAAGEPIREVCHRPEKVADFLGKEAEEKLTEEDIVRIAVSTEALRKCVDGREYRVLLNKSDIPGKSQAAERIADRLEEQGIHAAWGSLKGRDYYIFGEAETGSNKAAQMQSKRVKLAFIMLAAGNSRRFGSNKLMYEVDGVPMYQRTLRQLRKAAEKIPDSRIILVTQPQYSEIIDVVKGTGAEVLFNPQPERGIASSMQIGLESAKDADACMFTVADQPWLTAETIIALYDAFQSENKGMACIRHGEKTGNPCVFSKKYYKELMGITGDRGGKQVIKRHPEDVVYFKISDERELQDVDVSM